VEDNEMSRFWLAIRVFFRVLFDLAVAAEVEKVLVPRERSTAEALEKPDAAAAVKPKPKPAAVRSEALTLLAALQREARFVDFIQEPIDTYSDAQVGAAVREVHRQCAAVLERLFVLQPVLPDEEGREVEVPPEYDAARFRLTGNVAGLPPHRGKLVHHGWEAAKCDLPAWTGASGSARVVAPAEVEVQ
jgi:hypothetical protein